MCAFFVSRRGSGGKKREREERGEPQAQLSFSLPPTSLPTLRSPTPLPFKTMASGLARALGDASLVDETGADYVPGAILVTGGAGFIASHVVIRLVEAGHKVRAGERERGPTEKNKKARARTRGIPAA